VNTINAPLYAIAISIVLFGSILVFIEIGRRIGAKRMRDEGEMATKGFGAVEGAVFGLLGLVLAFSFSGALTRFDGRRQLVIDETNNIGTAWLRIDLLPQHAQPAMRDLFRRYLDSRILTFQKIPNIEAAKEELKRTAALQNEIWKLAISSSQEKGTPQEPVLVLQALNAMFDITTTRTEIARFHLPIVIFWMLGALALACALFAGYDMSQCSRLNVLHSLAFAAVFSVTIYVIVDLEYPRAGFITITDSDQAMMDLRRSMD
jgi:hypothetical protein